MSCFSVVFALLLLLCVIQCRLTSDVKRLGSSQRTGGQRLNQFHTHASSINREMGMKSTLSRTELYQCVAACSIYLSFWIRSFYPLRAHNVSPPFYVWLKLSLHMTSALTRLTFWLPIQKKVLVPIWLLALRYKASRYATEMPIVSCMQWSLPARIGMSMIGTMHVE